VSTGVYGAGKNSSSRRQRKQGRHNDESDAAEQIGADADEVTDGSPDTQSDETRARL
jgi:hypothetical protein